MAMTTTLRPLAADPARLLALVPALGPVVARTRSAAAVLDCAGTYGEPDIGEHTGIVIGDGIDLRVFPSGWKRAFASSDAGGEAIVVHDAAGLRSHEIVLEPRSDRAAFGALVAALAIPATDDAPVATPGARAARGDAEVDVAAYRAAYAAMQDTHDFFMLLRRFGIEREQGLRLADPAFARPVASGAYRELFAAAIASGIPLMLFVASDGMVQIASGPLASAADEDGTYVARAERTTLRVEPAGVARAWAVRKPTSLGIVTSLELYAAGGELVLQVFGERHAGEGERDDWQRAVAALG